MIIYHHEHKDRAVLELEENELTLVAYLIEKSSEKHKDKLQESLSEAMNKKLQEFINN